MKLNNIYISSLKSLSKNFDFVELWYKRDIAIRDLSPEKLYYEDDSKPFYNAFACPEIATYQNGVLTIGDTEITLEESKVKLLDRFSPADAIRIICIYKLANQAINSEILRINEHSISNIGNEIILRHGVHMSCEKMDRNTKIELSHKVIRVPKEEIRNSKVGDYTLKPGMATYGIFCNDALVYVVPPSAHNESFYLKFSYENGNMLLLVKNTSSGKSIMTYRDVHGYALLGHTDFAVIEGGNVYCFCRENLNNRLRRQVLQSMSPEILHIQNDTLTVIYKDGSEINFKF